MNTIKQIEKNLINLDSNFNKLISNNSLDINSIEELAVNSINDCANAINNHIEELISKNIDVQELINKKNKSGKKKDLN